MTGSLEISGLSVSYAGTRVVRDVHLTVERGETLALLGPSGSGKTTLLYAIAGLVAPDAGTIELEGTMLAARGIETAPEERGIGLVFQNYALWPHMTAVETVAYPIRRRGLSPGEAHREASALLDLVGIADLSDRKPNEMSGGQQQRVGLARALAREALLYLFDEPTAHLDANLRVTIQGEIARIRRDSGAGAIYATHDATEALAIADRVALMRDGRIVQAGTPVQVYEEPIDFWAASLTGRACVLSAEVSLAGAGPVANLGGMAIEVGDLGGGVTGGPVDLVVRPEWVHQGGPISGPVSGVRFRGAHTEYVIETHVGQLVASLSGPPRFSIGELTDWTVGRGWPVEPSVG